MELIRAAESDYEEVLALYRRAADLMQREGSTQWHWGVYPTDEMILEDIRMGRQYIQRADGVIAAVVSITDQSEPEFHGPEACIRYTSTGWRWIRRCRARASPAACWTI